MRRAAVFINHSTSTVQRNMTLLRFCLMLSLATALSSTLAISTVASNANSRTSANLSLKRILGFVSFEGTTSPTAQTDESSNPVEDPWEVGTRVYKDFEDFGWYFGTITSFENDEYVVTYEDGTIETYDYDSVFLDVLVDFADNYIGYDTYTLVAQEVQGGLMMGYISNFDVRATNEPLIFVFRMILMLLLYIIRIGFTMYLGMMDQTRHIVKFWRSRRWLNWQR